MQRNHRDMACCFGLPTKSDNLASRWNKRDLKRLRHDTELKMYMTVALSTMVIPHLDALAQLDSPFPMLADVKLALSQIHVIARAQHAQAP